MPERRRRIRRPWRLTIIGFFFSALPFLNYFIFASHQDFDPLRDGFSFAADGILILILLVMPVFIAFGIFRVTIWGWYSTIVYSVLLIGYSVYCLATQPADQQALIIIQIVLAMAVIFLMVRQDLVAPYFDTISRGWRTDERERLHLPVELDGSRFVSNDLSIHGISVIWERCPHDLNQELLISLHLGEEHLQLKGGLVRIDGDRVGIAFRELSDEQQASIRRYLFEQRG